MQNSMVSRMEAGHGKRLPTIYRTPGVTESREVLSDNRTGNIAACSVTSLPVVREQYCLCTPQTKLEKRLVITIIVLIVIILVLLVGISVLADQQGSQDFKHMMNQFTSKF